MRILFLLWAVILILANSVVSVTACSHFAVSFGDTVFAAHNKDYPDVQPYSDWGYYYWCYPPSEEKHGRLMFGIADRVAASWAYPRSGVNDQGLFVDVSNTPNFNLWLHDDKPDFPGNRGDLRVAILENCSTVLEAIDFIACYDYPWNVIYLEPSQPVVQWNFQFLIADKHGDAVLIEAGNDGELNFTRKNGKYLHGTNFNTGDPWARYEEGYCGYPCERYEKAQEMLDTINSEKDLTLEYVHTVLKAICQQPTVGYSTIYNLSNGSLYLYRKGDFRERVVLYLEEELAKGEYNCTIDGLFESMTTASSIKAKHKTTSSVKTSTDAATSMGMLSFFLLLLLKVFLKKRRN
ncbi:MAG: hypothetical protein ACFFB3_07705 [Candidatus Hodarchaeota archaeon]